jgi:hypothetical protein
MRSHIRTAEEDSQMETVSGLIEERKVTTATFGGTRDRR